MLYDKENDNFSKIDTLEKNIKQIKLDWQPNNAFKNLKLYLKSFFTKLQSNRSTVNDGSRQIRNEWSKVMCDLNNINNAQKDDFSKVYYASSTKQGEEYEIRSGALNILNVIEHILGISLEKHPSMNNESMNNESLAEHIKNHKNDADQDYKDNLKQYLQNKLTIFLSLCGNEDKITLLDSDVGDKQSQDRNPFDRLPTKLIVDLENLFGTFSFTIQTDPSHAYIQNFNSKPKSDIIKTQEYHITTPNLVQENPLVTFLDEKINITKCNFYDLYANGILYSDEIKLNKFLNKLKNFYPNIYNKYITNII